MALKYAESPESGFRTSVPKGFTATSVTVTEGEKPMVHLELRSGDGDTDEPEAQFDLYVNPDSLLIERIEGQEPMPGGGSYETTLEITPEVAEAEPAPEGEPFETEPYGPEPMPVDTSSADPEPAPVPPTRNPMPVRPR
jgi:hypothetical protein